MFTHKTLIPRNLSNQPAVKDIIEYINTMI